VVTTTSIAGRTVRRMGFGCFPLTGGYGTFDRSQGERVIHAVLDAGVALLDTSDAYAAGANEELVGRALEHRRDEAVICTKFGWILDASGKAVALDSSPNHVRRACEASLKRLDTDHIDVYIQHRRDPDVAIEDTVAELGRLQDAGKILSYGLSEVSGTTLGRAHAARPVGALQTEYSLWSREPEAELLPACSAQGIVFMAYSPLGRGFLGGGVRSSQDLPVDDFRRGHPRFQEENIRANRALVTRLTEIATGLGHTTSQLALAWLLAQPWNVLPIPATTKLEHLDDNVGALDIDLPPDVLEAVSQAVPANAVHGARHPAEHMRTINR
jgi:aryl-alcohol dehydrogenase-like predicted oxidoreductase